MSKKHKDVEIRVQTELAAHKEEIKNEIASNNEAITNEIKTIKDQVTVLGGRVGTIEQQPRSYARVVGEGGGQASVAMPIAQRLSGFASSSNANNIANAAGSTVGSNMSNVGDGILIKFKGWLGRVD